MHWVLQEDKDNTALAELLERMDIPYSVHSQLRGIAVPPLDFIDPNNVIVFGFYSALEFSVKQGFEPGVFLLNPYVLEASWQPYLLNPRASALILTVRDVLNCIADDSRRYFVRPVEDSKFMSGKVMTAKEIRQVAETVLDTDPAKLVKGRLAPETELLLSPPVTVLKEWRVWVVDGQIVTWSLYRMAGQPAVQREIDDDALEFAQQMVAVNPAYSKAYVIDVCRTEDGMRIVETNCINASGYYDADLQKLICAFENLVHSY